MGNSEWVRKGRDVQCKFYRACGCTCSVVALAGCIYAERDSKYFTESLYVYTENIYISFVEFYRQ